MPPSGHSRQHRAVQWRGKASGIGSGPSSPSSTNTVSHTPMHSPATKSPVDATNDVRPIRPTPAPVWNRHRPVCFGEEMRGVCDVTRRSRPDPER